MSADAPLPEIPTPCGVLVIDKEVGFTSMDVCAIVRTRFRRGGAPKRLKVGHAGTLDPMATGVLVVLVGKATRACDRFMADRKTYETVIDFSRRSETDDAEGRTEVVDGAAATREDLERTLRGFVGTIQQRPPAYSAVHVGGKRAYELARAGKTVEIAPRPVVVHAIEVLDFAWPSATLRVECGKGTYIRSLARDLGAALGAGGMLTALRRTRSGEFGVECAKRLSDLPDVLTQAALMPLMQDGAAPGVRSV